MQLSDWNIPEGKVVKITCDGRILWAKRTIPSEYQRVEWISNNIQSYSAGSYIDLGFPFETGATIHLNFIASSLGGYPFGATENEGTKRCAISIIEGEGTSAIAAYGSHDTDFIRTDITWTHPAEGEQEFNFVFNLKNQNLYIEDTISGDKSPVSASQTEYSMTNNLFLFAQNYNGEGRFSGTFKFKGFKYYNNAGELICDLIPCYRKEDKVPGMYDMVRQIFLVNASDVETFNVGRLPITNHIDRIGYMNETRISQSNKIPVAAPGYVTTGMIDISNYPDPVIIRTHGVNYIAESTCYICVYDKAGLFQGAASISTLAGGTTWNNMTAIADEAGNIELRTLSSSAPNYFRLVGLGRGEDLILTINEDLID